MSRIRKCNLSSDRPERRRRSGIRFGCVWSAILLTGLVIYLAAYLVLQYFNHRSWSQNIDSALANGNTAQAETLLAECRQKMPSLAAKPIFRRWSQQLDALKKRDAEKRRVFRKKLNALEKKLDAGSTDGAALKKELTATAFYASDESELAEVRALQMRCDALNRLQILADAQNSVNELQELRIELAKLQNLLQNRRHQEFNALFAQCRKRLVQVIHQNSQLPEIAAESEKLRWELQTLLTTAERIQDQAQKADLRFQQILRSDTLEEALEQCNALLEEYPQSRRVPEVKALRQSLELLKHDYKSDIDRQLQTMEKHSRAAYDILQKHLLALKKSELEVMTCELILQTAPGKYLHWETYQRPRFTFLDDRTAFIEFTAIDNQVIRGRFDRATGRGTVETPGKIFSGTLTGTSAQGALPQAMRKQWLLKLLAEFEQLPAADSANWLTVLEQQLANNAAAGEKFNGQIKAMIAEALDALGGNAGQFIFNRQILEVCALHTPQWCGFITIDPSGTYRWYLPASCPRDPQTASLWLVSNDREFKFTPAGYGQTKSTALYLKKDFTFPRAVGVLAVEPGGLDYPQQLKRWRQQAAAEKLVMPGLPLFLRGQ